MSYVQIFCCVDPRIVQGSTVLPSFHSMLIMNDISRIMFSGSQMRRLRIREISQPIYPISFLHSHFYEFLTYSSRVFYVNIGSFASMFLPFPPIKKKKAYYSALPLFTNEVFLSSVHICMQKFPLFFHPLIFSAFTPLCVCFIVYLHYFAISNDAGPHVEKPGPDGTSHCE